MGSWGGRSRVTVVHKRNRFSLVLRVLESVKRCQIVHEAVLVSSIQSNLSFVVIKGLKKAFKI